jgi:hypothetical protein
MKKFLFWVIAVLITIGSAGYQRLTGPTYPFRGKVALGDSVIKYRLARSAESTEDCEIKIQAPNHNVSGELIYKMFKADDPWAIVPLQRKEDSLVASLPKQPPAGKLAYKVILRYEEKEVSLSAENPLVIRFKGHVPTALLIFHIIVMFLAMLFSTRAGLEALDSRSNPRKYALWATGLLFFGGMILGAAVQKYSFGVFWSGVPFGFDLTDNKTLIALVGWIVALIAGRGGKPARWWVLGAALLLLAVYLIPHSL